MRADETGPGFAGPSASRGVSGEAGAGVDAVTGRGEGVVVAV